MLKRLRPYQEKAISQTWQELIKSNDPILFEMSVGGGKSICIGSILKRMEDKNKRALCLVNSSELVRNNATEFKELGGSPSLFCASLSEKTCDKNIVFATPQSILNGINKNNKIADIVFNLIIVDECHSINYKSHKSSLMRIIRHYKQSYKQMRLIGFTGTPFRGVESIIGEHALFKKRVADISTHYLIEHGYLVPPVFGLTTVEGFDFSKCKAQNTGEFKGSDLQTVIDNKKRLTWDILQEVQQVMTQRNVCIVFCSTKSHCYEALNALPENSARIILGDTDTETRNEILTSARNKEIKYLISVNCLLTGVNVPAIDCIAWLRPTSSLLLYIQGIGRGLRLHENKKDCLVLDYSGNTQRFHDFDDPIINEAIQPEEENEQDYCIICPQCTVTNTVHNRRCRGITNKQRCDYFFEFKECECGVQNDIASRQCRSCEAELIDPNAKLSITAIKSELTELQVLEAKYGLSGTQVHFNVNCAYICSDKSGKRHALYERYTPSSEKARNVFYGQFVKKHVQDSSKYYPHLGNRIMITQMLNEIITPYALLVDSEQKIKKKLFDEQRDE